MDLTGILKNTFQIGQFIQTGNWTKHRLKIVDIGTIYFIVEHNDRTLGWREIQSCNWRLAENQKDWTSKEPD